MKIREFKRYCCMLGLAMSVLALTGCRAGDVTKEIMESQIEQEDTKTEQVDTETEQVDIETDQTDGIDAELAEIEAKSEEIETRLSSAMLNQMELNQLSAEWYALWDDELNSIWSRLKEKLDEETMAAIKEEQISWIEYKESEVAAKGEEFGMGSMRPLEENTLAAEMTRERVYELIELLR